MENQSSERAGAQLDEIAFNGNNLKLSYMNQVNDAQNPLKSSLQCPKKGEDFALLISRGSSFHQQNLAPNISPHHSMNIANIPDQYHQSARKIQLGKLQEKKKVLQQQTCLDREGLTSASLVFSPCSK